MAVGFFKKLAIADVISIYVDTAYADLANCTGFDILIAIFFFTVQIYCDFSGYSDIAIGSANLLGIDLMENFKSPYFSVSIKEFWARWHISLSSWFKDYVYIPLGGNRCSKARNYFNLMVTFLLSGLWHGANWTYVIWGGLHGLGQIIERMFKLDRKTTGSISKVIRGICVFAFANIAWVFFRAESLSKAVMVFRRLFQCMTDISTFTESSINLSPKVLIIIVIMIFLLMLYDGFSLKYNLIEKVASMKAGLRWIIYTALVVGTFFAYSTLGVSNAGFVYFQF